MSNWDYLEGFLITTERNKGLLRLFLYVLLFAPQFTNIGGKYYSIHINKSFLCKY